MQRNRSSVAGDLRTVAADEFWARLQEAMGRDGLLTYRYLGRVTEDMHGVPVGRMPIRGDMRNERGGLMAAPLAIAIAETGFTDFNAVPAPVTAAVTLLDDGVGVSEIQMQREVLRTGRTLGFSRTVVCDVHEPQRVIAVSRGVGIKLGEAPPQGGEPFPLPDEIADAPDLPPLTTVFGAIRDDMGVWSLPPLRPAHRSTSGSLHLGPIHVLMEAAATELAATRASPAALQICGWEVMFISPGLTGPFVASGEVRVGRAGRIGCDITLVDAGRDGRIVATAAAVFALRDADPENSLA